MEKMVIISTKNFSRRNSTVQMLEQTVHFDANCKAEVTEEVANLLVEKMKGDIQIVGGSVGPKEQFLSKKDDSLEIKALKEKIVSLKEEIELLKAAKPEEVKVEEEEVVKAVKVAPVSQTPIPEAGGDEGEKKEEEELKIKLTEDEIRSKKLEIKKQYISLKVADLIDVVKQAGFPEEEWVELRKDNLLDYIVNKMFESSQKVD